MADPSYGYNMMMMGLENFLNQLQKDNQYSTVDWGKLFRRKPATNPEELYTPTADDNTRQTLQNMGVNIPGVTTPRTVPAPVEKAPDPTDRSQYSPDNEYLKYLPSGDELIPRKVTPALLTALNQWEKDNKEKQDKQAREKKRQDWQDQILQSQAEQATQKSTQFTYDPSKYSGKFSKGNPWGSYLSDPSNFKSQKDVETAFANAVAWEQDQDKGGKTSKEPADPLVLSYKDLGTIASKKDKTGIPDETNKDALSKSYSSAIRGNINDPKKVQQYIDRYNFLNGTAYTYNDWMKQSKKQYSPVTNKPTNIASKSNNHGKIVKTGTDKTTGKKVVQYEDGTIQYKS